MRTTAMFDVAKTLDARDNTKCVQVLPRDSLNAAEPDSPCVQVLYTCYRC